MTTVETQPSTPATVEAALGLLVSDLGGSLGVLLTELGRRAGIWAAMADAGPLTAVEVATRCGVHPALAREWLRSQAGAGYVRVHLDGERYELTGPVAAAVVHGPGGAMVSACVELFRSMAEGFDDFAQAFATHGRYGWHQRDARYWHGTDLLSRTQLPAELVVAAVEAMPGVRARLHAGGAVLDVGCGYGHPTASLAAGSRPRG